MIAELMAVLANPDEYVVSWRDGELHIVRAEKPHAIESAQHAQEHEQSASPKRRRGAAETHDSISRSAA
jgi:hypothetical protein